MSHSIVKGDCLEKLPSIASGVITLLLTDLPYGLTRNRWDSTIPLDKLWPEVWRVLRPGGVACFTASQPFTSALVMSQPKLYRHEWIWKKAYGSNFANTGREPFKEHESVIVFSRGKWTYNKQMQERAASNQKGFQRKPHDYGHGTNYGEFNGVRKQQGELRVPSSVQFFNNERGLHPTQKPVALFEYLIRTYTDPGDIVLDIAAGSGTTGVAAKRSGRLSIQIEVDGEFCKVARARLKGVK